MNAIMLAVVLISVPVPRPVAHKPAHKTTMVCGDWQASQVGGSYRVCEVK